MQNFGLRKSWMTVSFSYRRIRYRHSCWKSYSESHRKRSSDRNHPISQIRWVEQLKKKLHISLIFYVVKKWKKWLQLGKFPTCNTRILSWLYFFFRWHRMHCCANGKFIQFRQIQRLFFSAVQWPWKSRKMDKNRLFSVSVLEQNPGCPTGVQSVLIY